MQERAGCLAVGLVTLLAAVPAAAAPKKKPRPTPTATPTPAPLLRAAGSCLAWVPGKHLVLAEVGTSGRAYRIDSSTKVETAVRVGARLRVLYVDGPEGPVARRILAGPLESPPAAKGAGD